MPATMNPGQAKGKNAGGAITKKRFVKLDTTAADGETVVQCSVAGEGAFGVSLFSVSTDEIARGKGASVITEGRAILESAEAIAVGSPVSTTNDGRAQNANTGDQILGYCDEPSAATGNECSVFLDRAGVSA